MSLVTRFSIVFLVALALTLGGFSASLYYVMWLRLGGRLDRELDQTLDQILRGRPPRGGEVRWALYDDHGEALGNSPEFDDSAVLGDRTPSSFPSNVPISITGSDGNRWRLLSHRLGGGRRREGPTWPHRAFPGFRRRENEHSPREHATERPEIVGPPIEARGGKAPPPRPHRPAFALVWTSLEPVEAELQILAAALPLISAGLWLTAALVGRSVGRRAFAPLTKMADAARALPWENGTLRLPSPGTRDELEEFAGSFNGLLDRLHEALERQKHFTGQASHQLCTPLAAFITAIEVARRRPRTIEEHERVLERLHQDANRLWRIVESLLFLARSENEAGIPDLETLDLSAWVVEHLKGWSATGHERANDINYMMLCKVQSTVLAHPPLLGQLLDNLLENACKYSRSGSPIQVVVSTEAETESVVLAVADEGCGIAVDDLPRVFEPFFRAERSYRRGLSGVGLGLAVVQRIAVALRGSIRVESQPGQGSRFELRLPLVSAPAEPREPVSQTEPLADSSRSIVGSSSS
jgi:signal transduction histidine kinase